MKKTLFYSVIIALWAACQPAEQNIVRNTLRAPAYPLVSIDPYTSAWAFTDNLYDGPVKHWTGSDFPLIGALSVDGQVYRFMGNESTLYKAVAKMAGEEAWEGAYTFDKPADDWIKPDFNDARWKRDKAAFGSRNMTSVRTLWEEPVREIWMRREVQLSENDLSGKLFLNYSHDDIVEIYINGEEVFRAGCCGDGKLMELSETAAKLLKAGRNIIAMHCENTAGEALIDVGLSASLPLENKLAQTAKQISVEVQATQTRYVFNCGEVELELTFTAPLLLDNLELISRPVNYLSYRVSSLDGKDHNVSAYFEAAPAWALNKPYQESRAEKISQNGLNYLKTGSVAQDTLGKKGDNVRIDWGYFYLCGDDNNDLQYLIGNPAALRQAFTDDKTPEHDETASRNHLAVIHKIGQVAGKTKIENKIMLGYDDIYSIQYFGENLRPYWNQDGSKTIFDAFEQAHKDYESLMKDCAEFDEELIRRASLAGGYKYAELCALAYRQAISAHKLVKSPAGELLFLSKENFSNGSIGTVDVTYPSAPLFLIYNPELCKGLLNHIFH